MTWIQFKRASAGNVNSCSMKLDKGRRVIFPNGVPIEISDNEHELLKKKGHMNKFELVDGKASDKKSDAKPSQDGMVDEKDIAYSYQEAKDMNKAEQVKLLNRRGITEIGKIEPDRIEQIINSNPK